MPRIDLPISDDVYTVSRLNNAVKTLLEGQFPFVWVEGEVSNFVAPNSGHWYFSLKDATAQIRCAMFRARQRQLDFTPKDGMHVLIKARVSLYENRGDFQLIAESIEERGEGKLQRAFEQLKKKLATLGLFDAAHKKALPPYPKCVGVITSATGAAIRDILTVLKRRQPGVNVIIYPSLVQGATAAATIAAAIELANRRAECEVLLVARGGGSLEDLWPFNEEIVAHAIFKSQLPIISAVGHEIDFTIADFVADLRAPTPSAAAEMATPDQAELLQLLSRQHQHLLSHMSAVLKSVQQQLHWVQKHLGQQHPKRRLTEKTQQLDFCELTLVKLQTALMVRYESQCKDIAAALARHNPLQRIQQHHNQLQLQQQTLINEMTRGLTAQRTRLANVAAKLDALSPLATLQRGYAIAMTPTQSVIHSVNAVKAGEDITVRIADGLLDCQVMAVHHDGE